MKREILELLENVPDILEPAEECIVLKFIMCDILGHLKNVLKVYA